MWATRVRRPESGILVGMLTDTCLPRELLLDVDELMEHCR